MSQTLPVDAAYSQSTSPKSITLAARYFMVVGPSLLQARRYRMFYLTVSETGAQQQKLQATA